MDTEKPNVVGRNKVSIRVLLASFESEVKDLRAKLLTFRLANLINLKGRTFSNDLLEPNLQPRLQEILIPLKAMLNGDQSMAETLAVFYTSASGGALLQKAGERGR